MKLPLELNSRLQRMGRQILYIPDTLKSPLNIQMLVVYGRESILSEVNMCMAELVIHRVFLTC